MRERAAKQAPWRLVRGGQRGFTLVEIMMALAILSFALIMIIGRTATNVRVTQEMTLLDVATDLARSKMYDIEAELLHDGFPEMDRELDGDFADEGWQRIRWRALIEKTELPSMPALESLAGEEDEEGGSMGSTGMGTDMAGGLGSMMPIASMIESMKPILEVSIRKITLELSWNVGQEPKQTVVTYYVTDPAAMGQILGGMGIAGGGGGGQPGAGGGRGGGGQPGAGGQPGGGGRGGGGSPGRGGPGGGQTK